MLIHVLQSLEDIHQELPAAYHRVQDLTKSDFKWNKPFRAAKMLSLFSISKSVMCAEVQKKTEQASKPKRRIRSYN